MRCLFLLGAHRSGTTWLHHVLATSPQLAFLSYADIRQQLQLGKPPLSVDDLQQELVACGSDRGFDGVAVGANLPEEYGFVLQQRGFDFYANRPISNTDFAPLFPLIEHKKRQYPSLPFLLLKNPVDFYDGFLRLADAFPGSAFLFLHRHPWAVFRSQVLAWRQLARVRNAYLASLDAEYGRVADDPIRRVAMQFALHSPEGLQRIVLTLAEACDFHLANEPFLQACKLRLRYEDLCRQPEQELGHVCNGLGIGIPALPQRLQAQSRQLAADPFLLELFDAHRLRFKPYCDWLGYPL